MRYARHGLVLLLGLGLGISGCDGDSTTGGPGSDGGNNNGNGDGGNRNGGDGGNNNGGGDGGNVVAGDMNCGGMAFGVQRVPPNVMLVLDRSGSMGMPISSTSTTTKWQDLKSAMMTLVNGYDAEMRLGADLFADPNGGGRQNCTPGPIAVACGPMHGQQILGAINATSPGGSTPTATTMDVVIQNGMLNDTTRDNYVVLVTDGQPNCNDTDVNSRIATLFNSKPSVKTFVIGVGTDTASNPTLLDMWAQTGGTARTGASTLYYQANSPQDLMDAFNAIAGGIVSCTFSLSQAPPDPTQMYVWENGQMVPVDASNGYTYDASGPSITLHGSSCDLVKNNAGTKVQVIYGCPNAPIM